MQLPNERLERAGVSWKIYTPLADDIQYGWAMCPTFADCMYTPQVGGMVSWDQLEPDIQNGTLPAVSLVMP